MSEADFQLILVLILGLPVIVPLVFVAAVGVAIIVTILAGLIAWVWFLLWGLLHILGTEYSDWTEADSPKGECTPGVRYRCYV